MSSVLMFIFFTFTSKHSLYCIFTDQTVIFFSYFHTNVLRFACIIIEYFKVYNCILNSHFVVMLIVMKQLELHDFQILVHWQYILSLVLVSFEPFDDDQLNSTNITDDLKCHQNHQKINFCRLDLNDLAGWNPMVWCELNNSITIQSMFQLYYVTYLAWEQLTWAGKLVE